MLAVVASIFNALVIAWAVRRMVGIPVGWPRTIIASLVVGVQFNAVYDVFAGLFGLPQALEVAPESDAIGLVLVILLLIAWVLAVEVGVLTLLEVFVPTGSLPTPIAIVRGMPAWLRRQRRYAAIGFIALRHGLAGFIGRNRGVTRGADHVVVAERLRRALTDGGVTFVKLGQTLATRPDLLPPEYVAELSTLHTEVPARPFAEVRGGVEHELGRPVEEVFAKIEEQPLAAASLAQVHRGTLRTGEDVVLKVQRANARAQITADLDIVMRIGRWLQNRTAWGPRLGVQALAEGFATALAEEMDYHVEAANMAAIRRSGGDQVAVPRVWGEYSTSRLLVMQHMVGVPLSRAEGVLLTLDEPTRRRLAGELFDTVLRQVTRGGVFHADLHPGNVILTGADRGEPKLSLLDFGSVGRLDRTKREAVGALLLAFDADDATAAVDALTELLGRPAGVDDRLLESELGEILLRGRGSTDLFSALARVLPRHGFVVPPMVAAAFRGMGTLEGTLRLLVPDFDLLDASRARTVMLVADALRPEEVRRQAQSQLASALPLMRRVPRRLDRITDDLEAGRLAVGVRPVSDLLDRHALRTVVRELTATLLAGVLAVCGVTFLIVNGGPVLAGSIRLMGYLGAVLFLFAFVLGARVLVAGFVTERVADSAH